MQTYVAQQDEGGTDTTSSSSPPSTSGITAIRSRNFSLDPSFVEKKVTECLSSQSKRHSNFNLRLAARNNQEDADSIAKLVQGLAIYEKEPDAVNCTSNDYLLDGGGSQPLFYCILLDYYDTTDGDGDNKRKVVATTAATTTCGMAFIYFGYSLKEGPFLYLEDLFLQEAYRKKGGGSLALQSLADIGLKLNCNQFYWTALNWNTPALNLYDKIGAKVQDGLKISRFTNNALELFSQS